jgi:hypothetical protein
MGAEVSVAGLETESEFHCADLNGDIRGAFMKAVRQSHE